MIKGGIFLDMENLNRCGGWSMRLDVLRQLVQAQQITVLRANAYMAIDERRERHDEDYRRKKHDYRQTVRRAGFHTVLKPVSRYQNEDGEWVFKANSDIDLAIDALLQAEPLDYILLGTGDGDFIRLVQALQDRGKRVDLLSFSNTNEALRQQVDHHISGYLVPQLLPAEEGERERSRGFLHMVNEEKGYGFLTMHTGLGLDQNRADVFVHITDFIEPIDNREFMQLKSHERILEFTLSPSENGKVQARRIRLLP